ncbi:hypothetical protein GIB67_012981 [Kingdonia uniflora]|uniref:Uncharacterized protein n=1 Tax=Kingdonia uniflora TaxID=39325 RepID=A0A7J7M9V3_9MAGN|nr:hypothetical protein GIB67_012981 [Kingdonia uniflora]
MPVCLIYAKWCSIQPYRMPLHNVLKYFPHDWVFFPNLLLATPMLEATCCLINHELQMLEKLYCYFARQSTSM